jgi:hypothetical protein
MKRRNFIKFTSISLLFFSKELLVAKSINKNSLLVLEEIYEILFPKTSTMPSAKEFNALLYLSTNINHKSFLDYDRDLITQGTKDFISNFPDFLSLKKSDKSKLIHEIVNTNDYAQSWISLLMKFGIEAMFADPIYAGNTNQIVWKSIDHKIGYPRPKKKYGQRL